MVDKIKTRNLCIILLAAMALFACEKNELPDNITGHPSFYIEGSVDGRDLFFSAGPENIVIESNLTIAENGLPVISTSLIDNECQSCSQSFHLELIGLTTFEDGMEVPDYLQEGAYNLASYQIGQINPIYEFSIFGDELTDVVLETIEGNSIFQGVDLPSLELPDGTYKLLVNYENPSANSSGHQGLVFTIQNDQICGAIPRIAISNEGILTVENNTGSEGQMLAVNNFTFPISEPTATFDLEGIVGDISNLESIAVFNNNTDCLTTSLWTFEGSADLSLGVLDVQQSQQTATPEPMTAILKYIDSDFNTYVSSENSEALNVFNINFLDTESGVYQCEFTVETYLRNIEDANDSIPFTVTNSRIPLGN